MPTSYEQHIVVLALGFLNAVRVHVHDAASLELAEISNVRERAILPRNPTGFGAAIYCQAFPA